MLSQVSDTLIDEGVATDDSGSVEGGGHGSWRARTRSWRDRALPWLTQEISKLGLSVTPSVGNFLLIHFPETKGRTAADADAFLTKRGLVLRRVAAYKLPNALRMTVGSEEANRLVVGALAEFLGTRN